MKLKNILIVVNDIEKSKRFYEELFGLRVITDFGENVILTEGLVLQQRDVWQDGIGKEVKFGGHDAELYFTRGLQDVKRTTQEINRVKNAGNPNKNDIQ